jgi:HK97 family phage major capsid protein
MINQPTNKMLPPRQAVVKSFARYLRAIKGGIPSEIEAQGGRYETFEKSNNEGSGAAGGWLVPQEYTTRFFKPLAERGIIYPRAEIVPMGTAVANGPMLDATTVQAAGTAPFFGGILAKWGWESNTLSNSESEPQFRQLTLNAWDLMLYAVASNQLLQDMPPDADAKLMSTFGRAAGWYAEWAFFNGFGAGAGMPLGILNAPCAYDVARAGAGAISVADIGNMSARLLPMSWENAVWACSPTALAKVCQVTGYVINQAREDERDLHVGYLLSRPLFVTDKLPALGTRGDLVLLDPSLYVVGDRMQAVVDVSDQAVVSGSSMFQRNQSMFRVWVRLDGKPMLNGRVTLPDAAGTVVSSVVVLAA